MTTEINTISSAKPLSAARPVSFGLCQGLLKEASADSPPSNTAALIVSPWGFEEMSLRKFHRQLAEALADIGLASLRFDYPGTGDSLDPTEPIVLETWFETIAKAATELKELSGCENLILAGHGLGGTFASMVMERIDGVSGLCLMAPVVSGRMFMRETALWWKIIAADLGINDAQPDDGGLSIAGLTLPPSIASDIRKLKLEPENVAAPANVAVVYRASRDSDTAIADGLEAKGAIVARIPYDGHDDLVTNPVFQKMPAGVIAAIADWARKISPETAPARSPKSPVPAETTGNDFKETGLRFGPNERLYGVLCEPVEPSDTSSSVIILGTSYDRAAGWGRSSVQTARRLAAEGVASLRFDSANIGDSPPSPSTKLQVLYSTGPIDDTEAALDLMEERGFPASMLTGRCSGGYTGFQTALIDERVAALTLINTPAFIWDTRKDVDKSLHFVARPLDEYATRARDPETFRRLLRGEVNVPVAAMNILKAIAKRFTARLTPYLGPLVAVNRLKRSIIQSFAELNARGIPVKLVYAENDVGLEQFQLTFGKDVARARLPANAEFVTIPRADHNMTPAPARAQVVEQIVKQALEPKS